MVVEKYGHHHVSWIVGEDIQFGHPLAINRYKWYHKTVSDLSHVEE